MANFIINFLNGKTVLVSKHLSVDNQIKVSHFQVMRINVPFFVILFIMLNVKVNCVTCLLFLICGFFEFIFLNVVSTRLYTFHSQGCLKLFLNLHLTKIQKFVE